MFSLIELQYRGTSGGRLGERKGVNIDNKLKSQFEFLITINHFTVKSKHEVMNFTWATRALEPWWHLLYMHTSHLALDHTLFGEYVNIWPTRLQKHAFEYSYSRCGLVIAVLLSFVIVWAPASLFFPQYIFCAPLCVSVTLGSVEPRTPLPLPPTTAKSLDTVSWLKRFPCI